MLPVEQQMLIDALSETQNKFEYETGRRLAEANPGKALLATHHYGFSVEEFEKGGNCEVLALEGIFQEYWRSWYERYGFYSTRRNTVNEIVWQGERLVWYHVTVKSDCSDNSFN